MKKNKELPHIIYAKARRRIRTGDLISFKPCFQWYNPVSYLSLLNALTNKNHIGHSAMAVWIGKTLCCVQMDSTSLRMIPLSIYADAWPGKMIVSRALVPRGFHRMKAGWEMISIIEKKYGWIRIALLGFARTITGGKWYPVDKNDTARSCWPPVCSEAYSRAMRLAGFDPCPNRSDCRTEPHHLFESEKLKPLFVIV